MNHLIPQRQNRPETDIIFNLNQEAMALKAQGKKVINATVGALLNDDGSLAILPTAAAAITRVNALEWASYAAISGTPAFLKAVTHDLFSAHEDLAKISVATATPGGSGALRHALANYLEPGQAMLTTSFYWGPYQTMCDEAERKLMTFNMFDATGGFDSAALDVSLTNLLAAQGRALIFINDPCHNPTGYSMTSAEWASCVEVIKKHAAKHPVTLLIDTAYRAYAVSDQDAVFGYVKPLVGIAGLLVAWSASKTFTHYGLRVGALVAIEPDAAKQRQVAATFMQSSRGTWSNCTRGGLAAITSLMASPDVKKQCDAERAVLTQLLQNRVHVFNREAAKVGLKYPRYEGGFFVSVFDNDAKATALRMKEAGVFVVPSDNALRVALCSVAEHDVPALVHALAAR